MTNFLPWLCATGLIVVTIVLSLRPVMTQEVKPPIVAKPLTAGTLDNRSYEDWQKACASLPPNRDVVGVYPKKKIFPIQNYAEFDKLLDEFFKLTKQGPLGTDAHWLGKAPVTRTFFDTSKHYYTDQDLKFTPFVQRLELPADSTVIVHGDLHGDVRSLMHGLHWLNEEGALRGFKLISPKTHMLFLGDYCDRGIYGTEVMYTLLRLKLANPDQVWLVRGNHEEVRMISKYGFGHEMRYKFGEAFDLFKVARLYDFLPVALYLGCEGNYLQCNHGGMEAGFDPAALLASADKPRFQLLGKLNRADFLKANPDILKRANDATESQLGRSYHNFIPDAPMSLDALGFMWADFSVIADRTLLRYEDTGRWVFGKDLTQRMLIGTGPADGPRVRAVFRAHQQSRVLNPMMRRIIASSGVFRHWQDADNVDLLDAIIPTLREHLEVTPQRPVVEGAVYTFNVSPDSVYGKGCGYTFDTFGILTLKKSFEDWRLRVENPMVPME